jgi:hypothetical protein
MFRRGYCCHSYVCICKQFSLLTFASMPVRRRVLWHGSMQHFALVDCATTVDEDGSEHDRFFSNAVPGGARVPQWIRDAQVLPSAAVLLPVVWCCPCLCQSGLPTSGLQSILGWQGEAGNAAIYLH